jgi:oligopeptide/dipeptide ABC transporter ATP-binding protein
MTRLEVSALTTAFGHPPQSFTVVDEVSLSLQRGQRLAIVGESGSGKSMTALSIMRLLPRSAHHVSGTVSLDGVDLLSLPERAMQKIRGQRIAMVFQDALGALDPVTTIGTQIASVARRHHATLGRAGGRARAIELIDAVGLVDPERYLNSYPHQLSGGMRQRMVIAAALAGDPDFLIADEPTTALDVTVQAQIIELLVSLSERRGVGIALITHDLGVVSEFAHDMVVMYGGRVVESGSIRNLSQTPAHPYTNGLLACAPRLDSDVSQPLATISGQPPDLRHARHGCSFAPRCSIASARCVVDVPSLDTLGDRQVACHTPMALT